MDMKKTVRKMSAILAGATMVGATVMGAMAYDLSNYPSPFIQDGFFEGKIVIGEKAAPIDTIGATDIAAQMQADAVTPVGVGGTVSVAGGKTEEVVLGGNLATNFATLDNNDVPGLKEDIVSIDINGIDEEYDTHEELRFTSGATVDTGLTATNSDEDFKDGVYLLLAKASAKYYYVFDDALKAGNYINDSTSDEPITIEFLGKQMEIIGADNTSIDVQVGETLYFDAGQKQTVAGKQVTLIKVGDSSAVVSVDGVQDTISSGSSKKIGGLRVKVKEVFNDEGIQYDSATLIVGVEATKSYQDGDAFIGEDEDDPNWVWDLTGLETANPTLGVVYDQVVDDVTDDPITIGQSFAFPNDYAKVELVNLNQNDYKKYTVSTETGETLYYGASETSSAKVLLLKSEGTEEDTFTVAGNESGEIAVYYNTSSTKFDIFYKDHDDANKFKFSGVSTAAALADSANLFTLDFKDSSVTVDWLNGGAATNGTFVIDEEVSGVVASNLVFEVQLSANTVAFLGHSDGDTNTAGDVMYGTKDISGWEEDTMTDKGVIVYSYDSSASSDELSFAIPQEISDFKANVAVVGGAGSVSSTSGSGAYRVNPIPAGSTILDKDAMSLLGKTPLIVVGGPAVNTVAAELMGNPTREQINTLFTAGVGKIKLYTAQNALLVAGYEGQDTLGAAYVLKDYAKYDLTGTEVEVVVPSLSSITVRTPQ